jgi:hypothetical protein
MERKNVNLGSSACNALWVVKFVFKYWGHIHEALASHAEYPAVNPSAQTSPDTHLLSMRGSYLASIVIDLHTTLCSHHASKV